MIPQLMLTLCLCARSTAAESTLEGSSWQVPDKPAVATGAVTTHLHLWIAITLELHGELILSLAASEPDRGNFLRAVGLLHAAGLVGRDALHNMAAYITLPKKVRQRGATAMTILAAVALGVGVVMMQFRTQLPY